MGFRSIAMKPVRGKHGQDFTFDDDSISSLKARYLEFARWLLETSDDDLLFSRLGSLIAPNNDYFGRMISKIYLQTRDLYRCEAGKTDVAIDADGRIYSCFSVVGLNEAELGNVFTPSDRLSRSRFWALSVDQRSPCMECPARYTCGGGCSCTAFQANDDFSVPDPVDCILQIYLTQLAVYTVHRLETERSDLSKRLYEHLWSNLETSL